MYGLINRALVYRVILIHFRQFESLKVERLR